MPHGPDTVTIRLIAEMDLIDDAIRALSTAMGSLGCRHGERYRDYERRLEALLDSPLGVCEFESLEPGRFVVVPPSEWRAMVSEGEALGVI